MTILQAIFLGLVQGLTEFLPVSSSGHLAILQNLFGLDVEGNHNLLFDVLLHLATLASICVAYRKDIAAVVSDCGAFLHRSGHPVPGGDQRFPGARLLLMVVLATVPLALVLPVHDQIEKLSYSMAFVGLMLLLTGAMLFVGDRMARGRKTPSSMTVVDALLIGLCQAVATIPGLSRSGTTITAGLSRGLERQSAVKFSFLMSIPAVLGANLISLVKALGEGVDWSLLPHCLLGMATAGVTGYFAIRLLHYLIKKGRFGAFAYYCGGVGLVALIASLFV